MNAKLRETTVVTVSAPVDGTRRRRPRPATNSFAVDVERLTATVPAPAVQAALALAGNDLSRIRPVAAPEAVGGGALVVYNSKAQARRLSRR